MSNKGDIHKKGHRKTEYREEALRAARDLRYGPKVISKINNAENDEEIRRIMIDARHEKI